MHLPQTPFPRTRTRVLFSLILLLTAPAFAATPLRLHPKNPHYLEFRGRPTVIITSGEHYGAVLNLDFDFRRYLDTLAQDRLNNTRTFAGAYCEPTGAFNIASNTLAPHPGRFLSPFARSSQPGYANGGNKFDLAHWDAGYFERLKAFMAHASKRGVIVEMNLFCPFYEESMWRLSPMNSINNVNGVGNVPRTNVYTLDKHGGLLAIQESMVRQIVTELKDFDNLYYEICNEPYFGGVTLAWQHRIADVITQTERELGVRHLISQNIANGKARVTDPHPEISIFNFHYATPPETVAMNYALNKVIGDNETGFKGTQDAAYRMEAWDFIVAGGGLFNHLDYSFVAGHEEGTFRYPANQPGGGNPEFRRQMRFLSETIHNLDFISMAPDTGCIKGSFPAGVTARALVKPDRTWLVYIRSGLGAGKDKPRQASFKAREIQFEIQLPPGRSSLQWLDPRKGRMLERAVVKSTEAATRVSVPAFEDDVALLIRR